MDDIVYNYYLIKAIPFYSWVQINYLFMLDEAFYDKTETYNHTIEVRI